LPHQIIVASLFYHCVGLSDAVQNKVQMFGKIFVRDRETAWCPRTGPSTSGLDDSVDRSGHLNRRHKVMGTAGAPPQNSLE